MASLGILISANLLFVLVTGWALSRTARRVGSPRARFSVGLLAAFSLLVFAIILWTIDATLPVAESLPEVVAQWWRLIVQSVLVFLVVRAAFRLSDKRAFAPFAAYVALVLAQIGLTVWVIRPFVAEAFLMPTKSMLPTLDPGDRFIVDKMIQPRRLDLVAYWSEGARRDMYCKRLIGMPGERLRFERGGVLINDEPLALPPVLAGRCRPWILGMRPEQARYREGESIVLGPGEYFLIGDNASVSIDSRMTGPTRESSIVGVVSCVYWPLSKARVLR